MECDISSDLSSILCSEEQILMELRNLNCAKATGPDGISARMLKETANTVCQPKKNLFNLLITQLSFPTSWKFAHVVPIPKSSSGKASPSNYRPISLLPIISKIFERHIHSIILSLLRNIFQFLHNSGVTNLESLPLLR